MIVRFVLSQGCDDHAQAAKTDIDILALLQSLASCARHPNSFGPCQIHQIEFGNFNFLPLCILVCLHLLNSDDEDSMRPGR